MKWMTAILFALALVFGPAVRADGPPVTFEATLILASNDPAALDRRLDQISYQLRRIFKFEYFKFMGSGQASAALPSEFSLNIGAGNVLRIQASPKDGRVRAQVNWVQDGRSVLNTTVGMKPGAHAILGGIPHEDGTLIVTLVARR
jgi:hypothetical protein